MEHLGVTAIKNAYAKSLLEEREAAEAEKVYTADFVEPVYKYEQLHGEDQITIDSLSKRFREMSVDITGLEHEIANAAQNYKSLVNNIKTRLNAISSKLTMEEERIKDLNIICGNYNEFTAIKNITRDDVNGAAGIVNNNVFCAKAESQIYPELIIDDIDGNGYEGNEYVLQGDGFKKDSSKTDNQDALTDGSFLLPYEYSRLTATGKKNDKYPADVNFDMEEARCTIKLHSNKEFNMLSLENNNNIIIEDVSISKDEGRTYLSCLTKRIELGKDELKYDDCNYVYGSGIVAFPSTQYLKITLASNGITDEKIGYRKNGEDKITEFANANRHLISLNEINTVSAKYSDSDFYINDIVDTPVKSIAIFANEYIPPHFDSTKTYFSYVLTVNGVDYDMVPINSNKEGTKVIRLSSSGNKEKYAQYIDETIKSATLHVLINIPDKASTPYLSNLKICLGGEAS